MQSAATQSKDVTKAIGTSIAVVNPSRGGKAANSLQLQKPTSSGKVTINFARFWEALFSL